MLGLKENGEGKDSPKPYMGPHSFSFWTCLEVFWVSLLFIFKVVFAMPLRSQKH